MAIARHRERDFLPISKGKAKIRGKSPEGDTAQRKRQRAGCIKAGKAQPVRTDRDDRIVGAAGHRTAQRQSLAGDDGNAATCARFDPFGFQQGLYADEACDEGIGGPLEEAGRRIDLLDPSAMHHGHAVGKAQGLVLIVGHQNESRTGSLVQAAEFVAHLLAQALVKARQRLVEKQYAGLHDQCAGEGNALALAAGHHADLSRAEAAELHQLQRIVDLLLKRRSFQTPKFQPVSDVLGDCHMRE